MLTNEISETVGESVVKKVEYVYIISLLNISAKKTYKHEPTKLDSLSLHWIVLQIRFTMLTCWKRISGAVEAQAF